jgi:hypothetical protein
MDTRKISPLWLLVILLLASCAGKMTDAQFQDHTGTQIITTDTNYRIGILPSPAPVLYGDKNAIVVAMAVEGEELPMKLVELTGASLVSTNGRNYPVALVTGMNCWPGRIDTKEAWYHVSVLPICGTGNPGVDGVNGIVFVFPSNDNFDQAVGINFSIDGVQYYASIP